jgi:hypothetical protein
MLSVLTQNTPLAISAWAERAAVLTQTSRDAGLSVTGVTAVAVKPARPAGPSVVTTCTASATRLMPSRKSTASIWEAPVSAESRGKDVFNTNSEVARVPPFGPERNPVGHTWFRGALSKDRFRLGGSEYKLRERKRDLKNPAGVVVEAGRVW